MATIEIDESVCAGHGKCYAIAPEMLTPRNDLGQARVTVGNIDVNNTGAMAKAAAAVAACPERALTFHQE